MEKKIVLWGMAVLALSFGLMVASCGDEKDGDNTGTGGGATTGTLTLHNVSTYDNDSLTKVEIFEGLEEKGTAKETYDTPIQNGGKNSWTLAPGAYFVKATDAAAEGPYKKAVNIKAGETVNVSYNGDGLQ